jgi:hypothetical protein
MVGLKSRAKTELFFEQTLLSSVAVNKRWSLFVSLEIVYNR